MAWRYIRLSPSPRGILAKPGDRLDSYRHSFYAATAAWD